MGDNVKKRYPIFYVLYQSYRKLGSFKYKFLPSQVAFYLTLSFVPLFMLIISILTNVLNIQNYEDLIFFQNFNIKNIEANSNPSGSILGYLPFYIIVIWIASKGYYSIDYAISVIYEEKHEHIGIVSRITAFLMTTLLLLIITLELLLFVFGKYFILLLIKNLNIENLYIYNFLTFTLNLFVLFILLYFLQSTTNKVSVLDFKHHFFGVLITEIAWIITTIGFRIYVNYFANFERIYGGFTTSVVFLLWINLLSYFLIYGAMCNKIINDEKVFSKK